MALDPGIRVWRYMSYAKLVWILQNKQLWFSSAEMLDDKWEAMPDTTQLNSIISSHPTSISAEEVFEQTANTIKTRRKQTFVNCWTASEHESHALWQTFCPSPESVAIQTTLEGLKKSIHLPVLEVSYGPHEATSKLPGVLELATQKRSEYAYEQEVRIVLAEDYSDPEHPERNTVGVGVSWDPEISIENIWIHPDAQFWFIETVTQTVRQLAPGLCNEDVPRVWWSKMSSTPPLLRH